MTSWLVVASISATRATSKRGLGLDLGDRVGRAPCRACSRPSRRRSRRRARRASWPLRSRWRPSRAACSARSWPCPPRPPASRLGRRCAGPPSVVGAILSHRAGCRPLARRARRWSGIRGATVLACDDEGRTAAMADRRGTAEVRRSRRSNAGASLDRRDRLLHRQRLPDRDLVLERSPATSGPRSGACAGEGVRARPATVRAGSAWTPATWASSRRGRTGSPAAVASTSEPARQHSPSVRPVAVALERVAACRPVGA